MIVHVISGLVRAPHACFGRGVAAEPTVTEPTSTGACTQISPTRTILRIEGRIAHPCTTDMQLVCIGQ
eukprot:scaffold26022_cov45-Phaeocystis_antarctica.AAC.2